MIGQQEAIDGAAKRGITLDPEDFGPDGTIDGMDPLDWIDAMTME